MYLISPITVFDEENELFETKIGLDNKEMTLLLSAWGRTYEESRQCAEGTVKRLAESITSDALPPGPTIYPNTKHDMIRPDEPVKR